MNFSSCFAFFLWNNISCPQHTLFHSLMNTHSLDRVGHVTVLEDLPHTVVVNSVFNIITCLHFLPNKSLEHFSPPGS